MKINITEKKQDNTVRYDTLPIGAVFISGGGALCIKLCIEQYINFDSITVLRHSDCLGPRVEPVEIESIDIKIVRGSHSGTNR